MTLAEALEPYTVTSGPESSDEPARPFWQTEPCPRWCEDSDRGASQHKDREMRDDRRHYGIEQRVPLLLEEPVSFEDPVHGPFVAEYASLYLSQHVEHREPTIYLGKGEEGGGLTLRLEEAEQIAEKLTALVREALAAG